ncbi:MAG TPA: hypothetical protein VFJ06_14140 [Halococcus sp.]|nr:hypothetical protein [Halococcus sp.]
MNTTTPSGQNDVAQSDDPERCDRCGAPTADGDARTESLLDGGVFCSPKCAMRGADE